MKYAVVESGGKQYRVRQGDVIDVDALDDKKDGKYKFSKVLLLKDNETTLIGQPYLNNVTVSGKVIDHIKGKKITIEKFKAKVNYRRKIGFRGQYTKILVEKISLSKEPAKKVKK